MCPKIFNSHLISRRILNLQWKTITCDELSPKGQHKSVWGLHLGSGCHSLDTHLSQVYCKASLSCQTIRLNWWVIVIVGHRRSYLHSVAFITNEHFNSAGFSVSNIIFSILLCLTSCSAAGRLTLILSLHSKSPPLHHYHTIVLLWWFCLFSAMNETYTDPGLGIITMTFGHKQLNVWVMYSSKHLIQFAA